jgi:hypothetical protein
MEVLSADNKSIDKLSELLRIANRNPQIKEVIQECQVNNLPSLYFYKSISLLENGYC